MTATAEKKTGTDTAGRVVRVTGPVVDVEFPRGSVPELFNALHAEIDYKDLAKTLTLEVASRRRSTSWNRAPRCWRRG
jgi:F-type H+/Na+-transporting ATPase subunit beta